MSLTVSRGTRRCLASRNRLLNTTTSVRFLDADGTVLLCLHQWGAHGHPPLTRPDPPPGNGLLLFFRVDDFDEALPRARALISRLEEEPHRNPNTTTMEFSFRDPDGYYVTLSALPA